MRNICEAMDRDKEATEWIFDGVKKQYEKVFEIIDVRWVDLLQRSLHTIGHILNRGFFFYKN